MAKISELNDKQLVNSLNKYSKRILENPADQKGHDILEALKKEILNRGIEIEAPPSPSVQKDSSIKSNNSNAVEAHPDGVQKFHSDDADFSHYKDAGFGTRALALLLDGILIGILNQVLSGIFAVLLSFVPKEHAVLVSLVGGGVLFLVLVIVIPYFYYYIPMKKTGQSLGKKILKIKVIALSGDTHLTGKTIVLREFLGKPLSSLVFGLGYLFFLFGEPTWHDTIADTRVVKLKA